MMNPEVKKLWLEALRSGKYEQGRGKLRSTDNKFCCLGVLCDISNLGVWEGGRFVYYLGSGGILPTAVMVWAGLDDVDPKIDSSVRSIEANDMFRKSFAEIADLIERNL